MSSDTASALHLAVDKQRWLQRALPADEYEQIQQLPLHVALSLYPDIDMYGPNASKLVEIVDEVNRMELDETLLRRKDETKFMLQQLWEIRVPPQEMPADSDRQSFGSVVMGLVSEDIPDFTFDFLYEVLIWVSLDAFIDPEVSPDPLTLKQRKKIYDWLPRLMDLASLDATKYLNYFHLYGKPHQLKVN